MTASGAMPLGLLPAAAEHLRQADPVLCGVIDSVGPFQPSVETDLWWALVDSIASQQLSIKAAATIVGRVARIANEGGSDDGRPSPETILATDDAVLRACGLSGAKTRYVKDLAAKWLDRTIDEAILRTLPDDEVVETLTQVKGIGRWTAEMALIFSLQRPDVLPVDDLGLRTGVQRAYGLAERPGRADLTEIGEAWRPHRSAATLYLWRSLKNGPA